MTDHIQEFAESHSLPVSEFRWLVEHIMENAQGRVNADTLDTELPKMVQEWADKKQAMSNEAIKRFDMFADIMLDFMAKRA